LKIGISGSIDREDSINEKRYKGREYQEKYQLIGYFGRYMVNCPTPFSKYSGTEEKKGFRGLGV
jgi:hypothetical protein